VSWGFDGVRWKMEDRSLFISSCSRRELARRRPARSAARMPIFVGLLVLAIALGVLLAAHGGL